MPVTTFSPAARAAALALLPLAAACTQLAVSGQAGYAELAIGGDVALDSSGATLIDQDIDSAFGLGDDRGAPYARVQFDLGVPELTISGFQFDERGRGRLDADFGNVTAGTEVDSDIDVANVKASLAFGIPIGPVTIAPGLAVDWFDVDLQVQEASGLATEELDLQAPIPMVFVRGDVDLGVVDFVAEVGYLTVPEVDEVEGTFWDIEALLEVRPTRTVNLFAGYRLILIDAEGTSDDEDYDVDLDISGFMLGGGIRF